MKHSALISALLGAAALSACASLDRTPTADVPSIYGAPEPIAQPVEVPGKRQAKATQARYSSPAAQQFAALSGDGRSKLAQGDAAAAEYSFSQALEVNPFDPIALNNLAVAKAERNQFYAALGLLDRAAKLAPSNAEIAANLARMRLYVAETGTVGRDPLGPLPNVEDGLPPNPPALWDASLAITRTTPPGYYSSAGCKLGKGSAEAPACVTPKER